jgi:hypothetical protein
MSFFNLGRVKEPMTDFFWILEDFSWQKPSTKAANGIYYFN